MWYSLAMGKEQASGLGDRVRKRRKALGLTAKSLAKAAGVSTSYISQVERGHQEDPSLPALRRLADALSMDLHALLGAQAPSADAALVPISLRELVEEYALGEETVSMLSNIHIDGRQPGTKEDWLFLLLAIRRSCRIQEPLGASEERAGKYALRS
jgi:transcriptional regulator with XRE-family HTH domain